MGVGVDADGVFHQTHVNKDAPVIDFLVELILILDKIRDGEFHQPCLDSHFYFYISVIVVFESGPLIRGMAGEIP